jgi:1-acyl-sn-glycerol-3-phosphate acyltransferase
MFWGRRKFIKWPGVIEVEVLPPIPPGLDRETFMATLRERIEGATQRLVADAKRLS